MESPWFHYIRCVRCDEIMEKWQFWFGHPDLFFKIHHPDFASDLEIALKFHMCFENYQIISGRHLRGGPPQVFTLCWKVRWERVNPRVSQSETEEDFMIIINNGWTQWHLHFLKLPTTRCSLKITFMNSHLGYIKRKWGEGRVIIWWYLYYGHPIEKS